MSGAANALPDDLATLEARVLGQTARNARLEAAHRESVANSAKVAERVSYLEARVPTLQEPLVLAPARRYVAGSERISADQLRLVDEAEVDEPPAEAGEDEQFVEAGGHRRRKRGCRPLPGVLPFRAGDRHSKPR